jgi:hypothetical protein
VGTSIASTTTNGELAAGLAVPVTTIRSVWAPAANPEVS